MNFRINDGLKIVRKNNKVLFVWTSDKEMSEEPWGFKNEEREWYIKDKKDMKNDKSIRQKQNVG